ncbi:MAG TPA: DUF2905 domain-containing protein [Anaerolineae bacterium]
MGLNDLGKWMVIIGFVLAAIGGLLWLLGKIPLLGNLPGDIRIEGKNFGCFVPLGTMLLLSLLLTLILNIVARLFHK